MSNLAIPVWGYWLMGLSLAGFVGMVLYSLKKYRGVHRSLYAWPYGLWMVIFTVTPLLLIGYYAFTDKMGSFTLENFANFWDSNRGMKRELVAQGFDPAALGMDARGTVNVSTLVYSLWMALICTLVSLLLGYPTALIMADRSFKMGATIVVLFIIPMWMNFLLRTVAWMSLLEDSGLINSLLKSLGFGKVQLMYNSQAVLLGMIYNFMPFMVFPIYNALNKQDQRWSEASMDLGANKWTTFWKVTFPISMPGVISGITMVFMPSVTTFFIPRVLGGGNTEMFGDLIERTFLSADDWNVGSALSLIMMVLILFSLGLLRRVDPEGEGGSMI
jgi:spermidine/putrescine transport system permease protein